MRDRTALPCLVLLLSAPFAGCAASAHEEPLWEFGLGLGAFGSDDYRGSATSHVYPVPVAYLLYNGKFLQADRNGIRGKLFNEEWVEITLGFDATTPVRDDSARSGMPELRPTVQSGPTVNVHLFKSADTKVKLDLRLPLQMVVAVEAPPHIVGWTLTPKLNLDVTDPFGRSGWHLGLLSGPLFADRRYNDYFYSVDARYATPQRPEYHADAGYAGAEVLAALSKRFPRCWFGTYARYDNLTGAAFADSPLVQRKGYWSAGIGFAWMIHRSWRTVDVPD